MVVRVTSMSEGKVKILLLTADPKSLAHLQQGVEVREITDNIWYGRYRDQFDVVTELAVRRRDLLKLLDKHMPQVVHFSGHGSKTGEIFLLSQDDKHAPLSAEALKLFFAGFKDTVRLVFLNACHTKPEAEAIAEVIDCTVGTETGISDRAAIIFAASFYGALAFGHSIGEAVNQGKAQLYGEQMQEEAKVALSAKPGVDPYQIRLVAAKSAAPAVEIKAAPEIQTDVSGRVYLSYAPSRMSESQLITSALRDRGIPLCEEALDEDRHYMEDAIKGVLRSPGTAGGVLSLTHDAVQSQPVTGIELPAMLERAKRGNNFFIVAARFSDFDLGEIGVQLRSQGLPIHKISKKKPGPAEAGEIARLVLAQRIAAIHHSLPPGQPLRLELYTRTQPPFKQGTALLMDWTERFSGRFATSEHWDKHLLPALRDIAEVIGAKAPGRAVHADGRPSLPAVIALGCSFIQTRDIKVSWWQHTIGRPDQLWSLDVPREPSGFTVDTDSHRPDGSELAVLVSVTTNVEPAFEASKPGLPPFRAIIRTWKTPLDTEALANAGQAADVAFRVRDAIREARVTYPRLRRIHLFMAVPAGLAMMIGQLLNVLGPVQTYELESTYPGGGYRAAALVRPSE